MLAKLEAKYSSEVEGSHDDSDNTCSADESRIYFHRYQFVTVLSPEIKYISFLGSLLCWLIKYDRRLIFLTFMLINCHSSICHSRMHALQRAIVQEP